MFHAEALFFVDYDQSEVFEFETFIAQPVSSDYDVDTLTTRAGFNYQINRFFTLFSYLEYQFRNYNGSSGSAYNYDYDRWRWTTGIRLTY